MQPMGRRRSTPDATLQPRVYFNHGAYYYVHRADGKWENLGKDKATANERARLYNDPDGVWGTLVYWLDLWLIDCATRVKAKDMAARTLADYTGALGTLDKPGPLRVFFAPPMTPLDLTPEFVQEYLALGAQLGRPVPANREKAALSSCMGWLIRTGKVPGLKVNPCLRASGIQRNSEAKRERYVTHQEWREVWALAGTSVRLMMELTYRTLQRPESDIILWTTEVLLTEDDQRKLRFRQAKTGHTMKIAVSSELDQLIRDGLGTVPNLRQPIVRKRDGTAYTYDGLSAMLKRHIARANELRAKAGGDPMASWGFRDLKGKGATDMWRAGVAIELIQQLCGHADKSTTEIYVKARWHETAESNQVVM